MSRKIFKKFLLQKKEGRGRRRIIKVRQHLFNNQKGEVNMKILLGSYVVVGYLAFLQRGLLTLSQAIFGIVITLVAIHLAIALLSVARKNK